MRLIGFACWFSQDHWKQNFVLLFFFLADELVRWQAQWRWPAVKLVLEQEFHVSSFFFFFICKLNREIQFYYWIIFVDAASVNHFRYDDTYNGEASKTFMIQVIKCHRILFSLTLKFKWVIIICMMSSMRIILFRTLFCFVCSICIIFKNRYEIRSKKKKKKSLANPSFKQWTKNSYFCLSMNYNMRNLLMDCGRK